MKKTKEERKAYKKAKNKAIRPFKGLTITFAIVGIFSTATYGIMSVFDNTMAAFAGGTFWKLKDEDPNAKYYTSDFASTEEMVEKGLDVCYNVEAEGATLLINKDDSALPLKKGSKVSLFSSNSVNLVYGGTGSGNVDASSADTLKSAFEKSGFEVNETLWDFYTNGAGKEYVPSRGGTVSLESAKIKEAPWSIYDSTTLESVKNYNDAAIVTLSRIGGEGADLEFKDTNYLALDQNEKDLLSHLKEMKAAGTIKKVVVLLNTANPLQVDFLKSNDYDVDALLWIGDVGINGIKAVSDILNGDVNPSGKLVDTYCYDNYSSPAMANFEPITYEGYESGIIPSNASTYMVYQEGIYVGYKYYETRYFDKIANQGNAGSFNYDDVVAFPFGYGKSYTTFAYKNFSSTYNASTKSIDFKVDVTNTGNVAGKTAIELYVNKPYTEYMKANNIEVSAAELIGFTKTEVLNKDQTLTYNISVPVDDLKTYDSYGKGGYFLEEGKYLFSIGNGAHEATNNFLASLNKSTVGNANLVSSYTVSSLEKNNFESKSFTGEEITNQLSDADLNLYENGRQKITYLSRKNWVDTFPKGDIKLSLDERMIRELQDVRYDKNNYDSVEMPKLNQKNNVTLYDLIGKDYNDPLWDKLLDEMTYEEMVSLIGDAFHWTMPIESINAPGSRDENGPQGLTASLFSQDNEKMQATAFTSEDVMAATFNIELMEEVGNIIGNNCLSANIAILYGPGNNIHRTPYGGRNFEYYSEDGFLSGRMSAYEVRGIQNKGVHVVMKHFALNDSEQDRIGLGVWINEQAAREIYLKAFEEPFEIGNANGVMTAYTRWGTTWSGGNKGLMTNILRKEWGSNGLSITDNVLTTYVNGVDGVMAGVSIYDAMLPYVTNQLPNYKNDAVIVSAMREACHHNLYALANSCAMNGVGANTKVIPQTPSIVKTTLAIEIIVELSFVTFLALWIYRYIRFTKSEAYITYKGK